MDTQLTELMVAIARVDEGVKDCRKDILDLRAETIVRLDRHSARVDSLERTRDIHKGAGKLLAGLAALGTSGAVAAYFKFWS